MGQIDNCKLHEQRTDVWHVLFGGDERIRVQLEKCLKLVDALWTEEERQLCITKNVDDPKKFFLEMAERCKFAAWLIKYVHGHAEYLKKQVAGKKQKEWVWPQTDKPTAACKTQVQGMGNMVGSFKLDGYLPVWGPESKRGKMSQSISLTQWVEINGNKMTIALKNNPYRNKNKKRRTS
jgi:hypothetical protein